MVPFCCDHRHGLAITYIRARGTSAMKKLTLLAAAALSCCTFSTTFAQVQILRASGPSAAPRLVSERTRLDGLRQAEDPAQRAKQSAGEQRIPNPFDYFAEDASERASQPASEDHSSSAPRLPAGPSLEGDALDDPAVARQHAQDSLPGGLPVGRHHQHQRSVVDTIIDQAALDNVLQAGAPHVGAPHVAFTPVYWGGALQTPNPVAEWLLREECVAGLWAGYPQQRAAECAHMWAHLSAHRGHCSVGCGTVAGACNTCRAPRVRNRYLATSSAASETCGPCNGL